jgi:hypothetical protein
MATWPSTLPAPTFDGYQLTPIDPVIRSEMEIGAPRSRRRTAALDDNIALTWKFTDAQMATFRTWFYDAAGAAGGAAWFTGLSLAVGTTGVVALQCQFTGVFNATPISGLNWLMSAKVRTR